MIRRAPRAFSAFTLIELLVVIAIIAILASILIPVIGRVREQGDSTKCLHNLRQVGAGINSYAGDNDDRLPGPLERNQRPFLTEEAEEKGQLVFYIGKYLGIQEVPKNSTPTQNTKNPLLCPAFARQHPKATGMAVYAMNMREIEEYGQPPWGVKGSDEKGPIKRTVLNTWREDNESGQDMPVNLAQEPAMKDTDQLDTDGEKAPKPDLSEAPLKPVHGDHRNVLFYDWHVGKVNIEEITKKK